MSAAVANQLFQNSTKSKLSDSYSNIIFRLAISVVNSFHPSAQQKQASYMNVELDVEKRIQALVVKDRVRIKMFFIDFDKLRKGTIGESAVS